MMSALELALNNAMVQTCTERIWVCLNDWGFCWIGKWINRPIPCPPHMYDTEVNDLKNYEAEQQKRSDHEQITIERGASSKDLEKYKVALLI